MGFTRNSPARRHKYVVESLLRKFEFRFDTLGRVVPVAWRVIEHKSSSVSFDVYKQLLRRTSRLLPVGVRVRFIGSLGFADTKLMQYLEDDLGWHYRIRVKNDLWVQRPGKPLCQLKNFHLHLGDAMLLQGVKITKSNPYGQVNLALARDPISRELWYIVSDEPTSLQTLREYGERFDIESEFLDEKSNGFQLEKSKVSLKYCFIPSVFSFGNRNIIFNCSRTTGCASLYSSSG